MTHSFAPVVPGNLIHAQDLNQVINALDGLAAAGVPIVLTALSDPSNFALSVQNLESTNSRALLVLKSDGTQLVRVDVNGVTLGAPLNLQNNSINGIALENGTVPNAALGPDVARANLLTNGGFEIWQRTGPFTANGAYAADRWVLSIAGTDTLSVSQNTANVDTAGGSTACAAATFTLGTGAGATGIAQVLKPNDGYQVANTTLSVSVRVRTSTASAVRTGIYSGSAWTYSGYHSGGGAYETLTVTATMAASGAGLATIQIFFGASCTAYLDNACVVVGSQPANYVPVHPADDSTRCLRYYEVIGSGTTDLVMTGYATAGSQNWLISFPLRVNKPVTPTITKNGTWAVSNCGQPVVFGNGSTIFSAYLPSSAAGVMSAYASGAGMNFTIEANP